MAIYRPYTTKALSNFSESDRHNNQVVMSGTDETYPLSDGIFFLEFLEMDSGTATIKDGKGRTIATGVTAFNQDRSPIRCDYGITVEGDASIAKGFFALGVLEKKE